MEQRNGADGTSGPGRGYALRHPVRWLRGDHLPQEEVTPFERAALLLSPGLGGLLEGFTGRRNFLFVGKDPGLVPPNLLTIPSIVASIWDALNDPFVGSYMDAHPWKMRTHRWLIRASTVLSGLVSVAHLLFPGLSPMARVILWTVTGMLSEALATFATVSTSKVMAAVTPYTEQRRKLQSWSNIGKFAGLWLVGVSDSLIGFRTMLNITTSQIVILGAVLALPISVFGKMMPSFLNQRVIFPPPPAKGNPYNNEPSLRQAWRFVAETMRSVGHSFAIVRHNGWFIRNTIAKFITIFTPSLDVRYFYRFLIKPIQVGGMTLEGESLLVTKSIFVGIPGTLLMPMANRSIRRVGGEKNMLLLNDATKVITNLLRYFVGYQTLPRLLFMYLMEIIEDIPYHWVSVAEGVIDYHMLDYVEWKTGERSEGAVMAVAALTDKLATSNVGTIVNNALLDWSGFRGSEVPAAEQPKRFSDMLWPLFCLTVVFDSLVYFITRALWKPPADRERMERELVERRALANRLLDETLASPDSQLTLH